MANTKPFAEIPRFLLPRLTWTGTAVKGTASSLNPAVKSFHQRPSTSTLHPSSPHRSFRPFVSPSFSSIHTQSSPDIVSSRRPRAFSQTLPADALPIRHNGVYVASYKTAKRAFSTSRANQKDHHFDTLKFVQRLKGEGFSEEQAVAMMRVLNDVIEESIQNLTRTMVLKEGELLALVLEDAPLPDSG